MSFTRARQVYIAVVRPALAYGAGIQYTPGIDLTKGLAAKLQPIQKKYLRVVAEAYKTTPIKVLETETYIPSLDLYLDGRLTVFRDQLASSWVNQLIKEVYKVIQQRLQNKKGHRKGHKSIPGLEVDKQATTRLLDLGKSIENKRVLEAWTRRQQASTKPNIQDRVLWSLDSKVLKLYSGLYKAESSALVQFQTGYIGLAYFLYKAYTSGVKLGLCSYGNGFKIPRYILIYYKKEVARRKELRRVSRGRLDIKRLLNTSKGAEVISWQVLYLGHLLQFSLAKVLLYNQVFVQRYQVLLAVYNQQKNQNYYAQVFIPLKVFPRFIIIGVLHSQLTSQSKNINQSIYKTVLEQLFIIIYIIIIYIYIYIKTRFIKIRSFQIIIRSSKLI